MTRDDAYTTCFNAASNYEGKEIDGLLNMLVALKLIKFDDKKKVLKRCDCSQSDNCPQGRTGLDNRCCIWVDP